ncbi:MAG: transcription elongation factor GreA [Monoglobus pectinilyticus]|uniref:transcription elongation factor GreA n=1 Tax=Monoglobus pectinilyticus TaxID=1981510 RepID=UPI003999E33E
MDNKQVKLTEDGLKQLEEELEYLKTKKRKEVSEKIKVALGFGDLSENSEYDEAKNEQAQVEARIVSVEDMLKNAIVIDESERDTSKVELGATVTIHDIEFDEDITYKIVGSTEADPDEGRLSDESPLGKSLMGKAEGEMIDVDAPAGVIQYKILKIS